MGWQCIKTGKFLAVSSKDMFFLSFDLKESLGCFILLRGVINEWIYN